MRNEKRSTHPWSLVASMCRELREIAWGNNHDIPPSTRAGSVLDDLGQNEAFMREIQEDPQFGELREYLDQKSARAAIAKVEGGAA